MHSKLDAQSRRAIAKAVQLMRQNDPVSWRETCLELARANEAESEKYHPLHPLYAELRARGAEYRKQAHAR